MAFITFITRHTPGRVDMLEANQESIFAQTDPDCEQIQINDLQRRGVEWANGMMAGRDWSDIRGDYVMVLDDDDILANVDIIERLKGALIYFIDKNKAAPDLFVVQMDHKSRGILPGDDFYRCGSLLPERGRIGCSAVIPSRDLFLKAVKSYKAAYDGDYDYIQACFENSKKPFWMQIIATRVTQIGALTEV